MGKKEASKTVKKIASTVAKGAEAGTGADTASSMSHLGQQRMEYSH